MKGKKAGNIGKKGIELQAAVGGFILMAIVVVVSIMLLQSPAKAAKKAFECAGQGGICADTIKGNADPTTCPQEAEGYSWLTLEATCKKDKTEYACCKKALPVRRPAQPPPSSPQPTAQQASQQGIMQAREATERATGYVREGIAQNDAKKLLQGYESAKSAVVQRFNIFLTAENKDPKTNTPLDYSSIKGMESVSIIAENLRDNKKIENPYGEMCRLWALFLRGYVDGYWSEREYSLDAFYNEALRRINRHGADTKGFPYCEQIMLIGNINNLRGCAPPEEPEGLESAPSPAGTALVCQAPALAEDQTLDVRQPGFAIEPFFAGLDRMLKPLYTR